MIAVFEAYLKTINGFDVQQIEESLPYFEIKHLKKGDFFIEQNKRCDTVGFIVQGGVKAYRIDEMGGVKVSCFSFENSFVAALESVYHNKPSQKYIQAIEKSILLVISKTNLDYLLNYSTAWQYVAHKITLEEFLEKEKYLLHFHNHPIEVKFQNLLTYYPQIVRRAKVEDQASFLGITPRSLNRAKRDFFASK